MQSIQWELLDDTFNAPNASKKKARRATDPLHKFTGLGDNGNDEQDPRRV